MCLILSQASNENTDEFYGILLALSKNCSFEELTSSLIKDRVIVGIHDNTTGQKLPIGKGVDT